MMNSNITKIAEDVYKIFSEWNQKSDNMLFTLRKSYNYKYNGIEVCLDTDQIALSSRKHYTEVRLLENFLFCVQIPLSASKEDIANLFKEKFNNSLLILHNEVETLEKMLGVKKK